MRTSILIFLVIGFLFSSKFVSSQEQDSTKSNISSTGPKEEFAVDTIVKHEESPLDISKDRGLFIHDAEGKMQLRILGSIRFSALYDWVEMPLQHTFNTYYIPTGEDNKKSPNYYNSLRMTRIGFEVTRKVEGTNVFMRLETDFNGNNGQFRIRHAYGQVGRFLVGQTWSLLSNVSAMPVTVDGKGATGSVRLRTPQLRYQGKFKDGSIWAAALEYSQNELEQIETDSAGINTVQVIPDFTFRLHREVNWGEWQLAAIATSISTKDEVNDISTQFGYGATLSGSLKIKKEHKLLYQLTGGKSISHYISTFSPTGRDMVYNPFEEKYESLYAYSGFVSYGFDWKNNVTACVTFGSANQVNKSFQPGSAFRNSISLSFDAFWEIIEGARIGLEYAYGQRWDKDGSTGNASRIWALFYYDF